MNEVQIFSNPAFGQVRTVNVDGKIYFVASDVAKALGYARPAEATKDHCKGTLKRRIPTSSGVQVMNVIPEGDIYRLVVHSKLPSAEKFERWVFDEVLPSIRKTGSYSIPKLEKTPRYQTRLIATAVRDMGATADALVATFGCKKPNALAIAVPMMGKIYGFDPSPLMPLIPAEESPATLTATDVAEKLGFRFKTGKPNAAKVNKLMASAGLLEKSGSEWKLTDEGEAYGEALAYTRNGHNGYRIMWQDDVVDCLRQFVDDKPANVISLDDARKNLEDAQ